MESIISTEDCCYICGCRGEHTHHIFAGRSNRTNSEKRGFKIRLCHVCHAEMHKHSNSGDSLRLKKFCQRYYESHYGTREDFIKEFGKSLL